MTRLEERALLTTPTLTMMAGSAASVTYGQAEVFTATVTADPQGGTTPTGGTVTFMDGTTTLGTRPLTDGTAQLSVSDLGAGSHQVTANYSGTSTFGASTTPVTTTPVTTTPVITTVAGGGNPAAHAVLYAPLGDPTDVAVDSSGDLFIADSLNNVIREVNHATGAVSIVAGDGTQGDSGDGGPATDAELSMPTGVALDGSGDLFIADSVNSVVREVNLNTGIITTIAGNGTPGYSGDGGPATDAELDMYGYGNMPAAVAVDGSGDLFIADAGNSVVREVNLHTGIITTVAGDGTPGDGGDGGPATDAELTLPEAVAVDGSGDLFIADAGNDVVREVNLSTGIIATIAGDGQFGYSGDGGPAADAELVGPSGLALNGSGDLFIADGNNVIREVDLATGIITTVAGDKDNWNPEVGINGPGYSGDGGPATDAELSAPAGIAVDPAGDLFIADAGNNVVREVNAQTGIITTIAGDGAMGDSGDGGAATAAELMDPTGVALDGSGHLFITSPIGTIRQVNLTTGTISTFAGTGWGTGDSGDGGPATAALIGEPGGIAVDSAGDLYISDSQNNVVREVSTPANPDQTVTVAKAPLTVTANNATKVYGAAVPTPTDSITGFVNGDSSSVVSGAPVLSTTATAGSGVGTYSITVAAGSLSASNYTFPSTDLVAGRLNVTPAPLTIAAASRSKQAGQANPTLTASYSGLVNGDSPASLSTPSVVSTTATSSSPGGTYPITVSGATSPDYSIRFVNSTLTVTPARVVGVTFEPATARGVSTDRAAKEKSKAARAIVVQLSGPVDEAAAQSLGNYKLATVPGGRKKGRPVVLSKAIYDAGALTVTLVTRKKVAMSPPLQLTISAAGLGLSGDDVVATPGK